MPIRSSLGGLSVRGFFPGAGPPGAPTGVTVSAGATTSAPTVSVSWTAPASTGGAPITSYTVTSSPGNFTATGSASPLTVSGLTAGTAYTFTVKASNVFGTGPSSAASSSFTTWSAAGGSTSTSGGYKYHVFTAASDTFTAVGTPSKSIAVFVLGGGGGGGDGVDSGDVAAQGGSGAGGAFYLNNSLSQAAASVGVTIGAGGTSGGFFGGAAGDAGVSGIVIVRYLW